MQGKQAWDDGQQLADKQCGTDAGNDGRLDWGSLILWMACESFNFGSTPCLFLWNGWCWLERKECWLWNRNTFLGHYRSFFFLNSLVQWQWFHERENGIYYVTESSGEADPHRLHAGYFSSAAGFWEGSRFLVSLLLRMSNGVSSSCLCPLLDGGVCFNGVTSYNHQSLLDARSAEDTLLCGLLLIFIHLSSLFSLVSVVIEPAIRCDMKEKEMKWCLRAFSHTSYLGLCFAWFHTAHYC